MALVLQLVQGTAVLPALESSAKAAFDKCGHPHIWADKFWSGVLDRLPQAKAAKADTNSDLRGFVEAVVQDMTALQHLPEWPAAALMIRRLVAQLNSPTGLRHTQVGWSVGRCGVWV